MYIAKVANEIGTSPIGIEIGAMIHKIAVIIPVIVNDKTLVFFDIMELVLVWSMLVSFYYFD
jgi:hypothetical protein